MSETSSFEHALHSTGRPFSQLPGTTLIITHTHIFLCPPKTELLYRKDHKGFPSKKLKFSLEQFLLQTKVKRQKTTY